MKRRLIKKAAFIGKSLLWSLLLYVVSMLAINRDDLSGLFKKSNSIVSISSPVTPDVTRAINDANHQTSIFAKPSAAVSIFGKVISIIVR